MSWGIGRPDITRGPLDLIEGEPDRAEVLERIADEWVAYQLGALEYHNNAEIDPQARIVVELDGFRYRLALVAVEKVER